MHVVFLSELNKERYYMPLMCLKLYSIEVVFYFNTSVKKIANGVYKMCFS